MANHSPDPLDLAESPHAGDAVARLARAIAHDLGNTLTAALGHVQLIADSPSNATTAASAQNAIAALEFACRLTHQLRALGDGTSRPFAPLSLRDAITGIDSLLRAVVGRERSLAFDLGAEPAVLTGDAEAVARLVFNLVTNARDATRPGGTITISIRNETGQARLIVRDDGEGMPIEVRRRLFEPGFTTKASRGGSGLGLVAVQSIATAHGALVDVESEPGRGTTVTVRFPR